MHLAICQTGRTVTAEIADPVIVPIPDDNEVVQSVLMRNHAGTVYVIVPRTQVRKLVESLTTALDSKKMKQTTKQESTLGKVLRFPANQQAVSAVQVCKAAETDGS